MTIITIQEIQEAHQRIKPFIHQTPVLTSKSLDAMTGCKMFFKCENFQKIGAFKIRGGMNAALTTPADRRGRGLATHSSGNHAQAIAFASRELGTKAYIVMPSNSPKVKIDAVRGYGAEIIFCEPNQTARESTLQSVVAATQAEFVHPYDDDRVIAGQATCAKELIEEVENLDAIIAPVGGGGLLSGTCLSAHALVPNISVFAGEPEGAADAILSVKTGKVEKAAYVDTIADGLRTSLSERTLKIIAEHITKIFLVSDDEIKSALKLIYERMKIVIEPSSVVPFAAILKNREQFSGKRVGIIVSGGNVDLATLSKWY